MVGLFRRGEQHLWKTTLFTSLLGISTSTISGFSGDHPSEVVFLLFSMRTRAAEGDSCTTARQFCCLAPGGEEESSLAATDLPGGKKWAGGKEGRRERGFKGGRPPQSAFALRDGSDEEDIPED